MLPQNWDPQNPSGDNGIPERLMLKRAVNQQHQGRHDDCNRQQGPSDYLDPQGSWWLLTDDAIVRGMVGRQLTGVLFDLKNKKQNPLRAREQKLPKAATSCHPRTPWFRIQFSFKSVHRSGAQGLQRRPNLLEKGPRRNAIIRVYDKPFPDPFPESCSQSPW